MTNDSNGGATSSFMGLWETIAWVGSRDFAVASDVRVYVANWRTETGGRDSALTPLFVHPLDIQSAFAQISNHCATGGLLAKGRGTEGFQTVPADDWHEAVIVGVDQPDTIMIPPTVPFGPYPGWRQVRFQRRDVLALWAEETVLDESQCMRTSSRVDSLPEPAVRAKKAREPSAKRKTLTSFRRHHVVSFNAQECVGDGLYDYYCRWVLKQEKDPYGRTEFFRHWPEEVRSFPPD